MNFYSKSGLLAIILFISISATAQLDEMQKMAEQRARWEKQRERDFHKFKKDRDAEFARMLREEWIYINRMKEGLSLMKDKPTVQPQLKRKKFVGKRKKSIGKKKNVVGKTSESEVITEYVITKEDERSKKEVGRVSKNVYGESVNVFGEFAYLSRIPSVSIRLKRINERQIGQSWTRLNNSINKNLIVEMKSEKVRLQMNDWNYLTFVKRTSEKITFDDNQRVLVQWYLLVKSGYDAKVGYSNHHVHLLLPFSTRLYGDAYYLINKRRYYLLDDQYDISIRTYRKKYEGADKIFNLDQKGMELLSGDKITKRLKFQHLGKKYFINVSYNTALKDYYNGIPTTDLEVYFASSLSADIASQIKSQLRGYMRGMNQKQSVGFLLSFVQKGFGYKTDQQQFGKEKYFYPDEIFMYAFSDCEDRSVLFANLVEDMLGLKVIGVLYPNHVATAVRFTERVKGASVLFQGEKYTICDPTYIGAGPGKQMIVTKNENFEIISFKG